MFSRELLSWVKLVRLETNKLNIKLIRINIIIAMEINFIKKIFKVLLVLFLLLLFIFIIYDFFTTLPLISK